ncbi:hypothetical protein I307_03871 [Cryptococcus deuterogattii 99/473]|uniref:Uncharacterized protein n=2 Tax=Cryptococcus deuterogattii TaxID=1859096 RepID=A0A0D0TR02_9TREE|nr:hypothetical protein I309_02708 [Cryptococcus deuterogattii LA55]KIR34975.1 hypothetical protein I352_02233 [Cryptococcus deuterogattii MMRL2647]KIR37883.1 hypothetical protein I313_06253 [Cryptococcus deuterogattii Ram5]KIR70114.1 hypothetical protein I310_06098 [Cryptococcus deuterogattii CA1014]KIR93889.1 hypothetical protein I304_02574 [Cryptococcus deuterogattii CBS 10090]KIY56763.1 hypothetical protein I307_03871 [Cryptococcus deuterogattii 99/473]KNX50141.1 hypothetical protein CNBG
MRHFYLLVALFTLFTTAMAFPLIYHQEAEAAQATRALENSNALTNSERIARGLPVKQPKRYYDASQTRVLNPRASARRKRENV